MRHPFIVPPLCSLVVVLAVAGVAQAASARKKSAAEHGADLLIPPSFFKGKPISPDAPAAVPLLFVFAEPGVPEARTLVKKVDAACVRNPPKAARVILVVRGKDQADCRKNALEFGAPHLELLADPAGLVQAQFGLVLGKVNCFHLRSYGPGGKVAGEVDCESFLEKAAAPAENKADQADKGEPAMPGKAEGKAPAVERLASPRLKEAYAALDAGLKARALTKLRPVASDPSGKEPQVVAQAKAQVARIEQELDAVIAGLRAQPTDQYAADLETARAKLLPEWREDGKSKAKVEEFIKAWEKKDEVKNEYAARKLRLRLWQATAGQKPDRKMLAAAFQEIADKCPGTATGIQAAALAKAFSK